jgi:hypothetical protein
MEWADQAAPSPTDPKVLLGIGYWYLLYPFHVLILKGMLNAIARRSGAAGPIRPLLPRQKPLAGRPPSGKAKTLPGLRDFPSEGNPVKRKIVLKEESEFCLVRGYSPAPGLALTCNSCIRGPFSRHARHDPLTLSNPTCLSSPGSMGLRAMALQAP